MEIARIVHIFLKIIGKSICKVTGDEDIPEEEGKEKPKRLKSLSPYARAFRMIEVMESIVDEVTEMDIRTDTVLDFHRLFDLIG